MRKLEEVTDNPFTSKTYTQVWQDHFNFHKMTYQFPCITKLVFCKQSYLPIYYNLGKTHTKGISYSLENSDKTLLGNKVLLIYDVPVYFENHLVNKNARIGRKQIRQYPGFLIDLSSLNSLEEYLCKNFGKKSRYKFRSYVRRFENCFDVEYRVYYGEISTEEHNLLFSDFRNLMERRFSQKGIYNNNLQTKEWNFYKEVSLELIRERKASLQVVYADKKPVGFMLNYHSSRILFQAITVFDVDYARFNVGTISLMKLIEWCLDEKIPILDFSKGYYPYKENWGSLAYNFEYHIIYDKKSHLAWGLVQSISIYFSVKQRLREWGINEVYHRMINQIFSDKIKSLNILT